MREILRFRKNEMVKKINELEGYENVRDEFVVTSFGRVANINTGKDITRKEKNTNDYVRVSLYAKDGQMISAVVHRLVALAFIENDDPEKTEIDHINRKKYDNRKSNLKWITPQKNRKRRKVKKYYCIVYNNENKIMKSYNSISKCAKDMKKSYHKIYRIKLTGRQKIKDTKVYFIER